jgi:GNAT superfamily N-acetyltransferase
VRGGAAGGVSAGGAVLRVTSGPGSRLAPVIRRAAAGDIDQLIRIRGAVRENRLRDPASVTRADYEWFVARLRVWLAEVDGRVAGFSAGDPRDGTIWALFVDPAEEGMGLGAVLLGKACEDLSDEGHATLRLSTEPGTKAARLYGRLGWREAGLSADGEMQFVLKLAAE